MCNSGRWARICVFSLKEGAKTELSFVSRENSNAACSVLQEEHEGCLPSHEMVSNGKGFWVRRWEHDHQTLDLKS